MNLFQRLLRERVEAEEVSWRVAKENGGNTEVPIRMRAMYLKSLLQDQLENWRQ